MGRKFDGSWVPVCGSAVTVFANRFIQQKLLSLNC